MKNLCIVFMLLVGIYHLPAGEKSDLKPETKKGTVIAEVLGQKINANQSGQLMYIICMAILEDYGKNIISNRLKVK